MKFQWVICEANSRPYKDFVDRYQTHPIVQTRINRNLHRRDVCISVDRFWRALVGCLLTTQQRSGLGSRVTKFLDSDNLILRLDDCRNMQNLQETVEKTLSANGLRRSTKIANEIVHAIDWLNQGSWKNIEPQLKKISNHKNVINEERCVARFLQENLKGIGPKQSRNLIQHMGLSQHEIPLDSRMLKTLKNLEFPVPLSPTALADENYYCFIEDGIQQLMSEIDIYPCVFDACAFASFEKYTTR